MPNFGGIPLDDNNDDAPATNRFGGVSLDDTPRESNRFGGLPLDDTPSLGVSQDFSTQELKPWDPTIWEWIKSFGNDDSSRARAMNEVAARKIAAKENIPVADVYTTAGFQVPIINPEGRSTVTALAEGGAIVASQVPDVGTGVVNALLRTVRGRDETAEDTFLDRAITKTDDATIQNTDPNYRSLYGVGKSLGTSLVTAAAGFAAGVAASETLIGSAPAAMAASGAVAYRIDVDTLTDQIKDLVDKKSEQINGRPLNQDEWTKVLDEVHGAVTKHGLFEAGPEALSNLVFLRAVTMPMRGLSKAALKETAKKAAESIFTEQATETVTGVGQSGQEAELGLGKQKTVGEAFRDQVVQTGLLSGIMLGGGAGINIATTKATGAVRTGILGRELSKIADQQDFGDTQQAAIDALSPDRATLEAVKKTPDQVIGDLHETIADINAAPDVDSVIKTSNIIVGADIADKKLVDAVEVKVAKAEQQADLVPTEPKVTPIESPVTPSAIADTTSTKDIVDAPIDEIVLSKDVPQFKEGANAEGVAELKGESVPTQEIAKEDTPATAQIKSLSPKRDAYKTSLKDGEKETDTGYASFISKMRKDYSDTGKLAPKGTITNEKDFTQFVQGRSGISVPLSDIKLTRKITSKDGTIKVAQVKADVVLRQTRKKRDVVLKLLRCIQ